MIKQYHNRWVYCQKFDDESSSIPSEAINSISENISKLYEEATEILTKAPELIDDAKESIGDFFNKIYTACCPHACTFTTPPADPSKYFGFDDKTNLADKKTYFNYWDTDGKGTLPEVGTLSAPKDRMTRDGSTWISVAIGETVEIDYQIHADPNATCANQVTFEVDKNAPDIVTILQSKGNTLKLEGMKAGETSILAKCNGHTIGWVHVWCANIAVIKVKIANLTYASSTYPNLKIPKATYNVTQIETYFNETIFRQSLIRVILQDDGEIKLPQTSTIFNNIFGDPIIPIIGRDGTPNRMRFISEPIYNQWLSKLEAIHLEAQKYTKHPNTNLVCYIFLPPNLSSSSKGVSTGIPADASFTFFDSAPTYINTMAHELCHQLYLEHPNASPVTANQYPSHLNDDATQQQNWDNDDKYNLMGYASDRTKRIDLRKLQWVTLRKYIK